MSSFKCTGAEFKGWVNSYWGEDAWIDDEQVFVNGVELENYGDIIDLADSDEVEIRGGFIFGLSSAQPPTAAEHFNAWKKGETDFVDVVVTCPRNHLPHLQAVLGENEYDYTVRGD